MNRRKHKPFCFAPQFSPFSWFHVCFQSCTQTLNPCRLGDGWISLYCGSVFPSNTAAQSADVSRVCDVVYEDPDQFQPPLIQREKKKRFYIRHKFQKHPLTPQFCAAGLEIMGEGKGEGIRTKSVRLVCSPGPQVEVHFRSIASPGIQTETTFLS